MPLNSNTLSTELVDWQARQCGWAYAFGKPEVVGEIKQSPEDFQVDEIMPITPCGEGEHVWLHISKRQLNTDAVAKQIARLANVAYRDVTYSGMKDFHAVTRQWFSVWMPTHGSNKKSEPDWSELNVNGVKVEQSVRHSKKIKRGTHSANRFKIIIRDLSGDLNSIVERLKKIEQNGVPNYFGEQRFGRNFNNMNQAVDLLVNEKRIKNRNLRGIILSSARSWLFNTIVSERINSSNWQQLLDGEPANLNGSSSLFTSKGDAAEGGEDERKRLLELDIHPTAPLWGEVDAEITNQYIELHEWEKATLSKYSDLCDGLESARLQYQRRPIRMVVHHLTSAFNENTLELSFELQKGQFATSVLREIIQTK